MKKYTITIAIFASLSFSVLAKDLPAQSTQNQGQNQGQAQGQLQGQIQGQTASSDSRSHSSSSSRSSSNSSSHNNVGVGVQVTQEAQERDPVASAGASNLVIANGSCGGATTAGAQSIKFGIVFGSTTEDKRCDARYDAQHWKMLGMNNVAIARMCQIKENAEAFEAATGAKCPAIKQPAPAQNLNARPVSSASIMSPHDIQVQY